jgi:type VI secretion system secreted protein Hcp
MARSDMFLKATGQRTGEILGESRDRTFTNQIEVHEWDWGMSSPSAVGGQRTGRTLMKEVRVVKSVDKASTALMTVMRNNEILTTATLSVRKSGGDSPLAYFVMTLEQARITAYDVKSDYDGDGAPVLRETVCLVFKKVIVGHTVQGAAGSSAGATSFENEASPT